MAKNGARSFLYLDREILLDDWCFSKFLNFVENLVFH